MSKIDELYKELLETTQEKINLYAINNNQDGQRTQIEVLNAVKKLYAAHKEASEKTVTKPVKKSTKTESKTVKKQ